MLCSGERDEEPASLLKVLDFLSSSRRPRASGEGKTPEARARADCPSIKPGGAENGRKRADLQKNRNFALQYLIHPCSRIPMILVRTRTTAAVDVDIGTLLDASLPSGAVSLISHAGIRHYVFHRIVCLPSDNVQHEFQC